jgi:hypothetical protein
VNSETKEPLVFRDDVYVKIKIASVWLKDRKARRLISEDIIYYKKMYISMKRTIRIMKEIDNILTII